VITSFKIILPLVLLAGLTLDLRAQGTAFTYQGRLAVGTTSANGNYDFTFALYGSPDQQGNLLAGPVTNPAVAVSNGLFTTLVDFGNVFNNGSNWLQIAVSTNGANAFVGLNPRQQFTPVPYAISAISISGTVALSQLPAVVVTNNATGLALAGTFTGNGAGLTNLNAGNISSGSLPLAQLPVAVVTNTVSIYNPGGRFDFYENFQIESNQSPWLSPNWYATPTTIGGHTNGGGFMCVSNGLAYVQWPNAPGFSSPTNYESVQYFERTSPVPITYAEVTQFVTSNGAPGISPGSQASTAILLSTANGFFHSYGLVLHMVYDNWGTVSIGFWTNGIFGGNYTNELPMRSNGFTHDNTATPLQYDNYYSGNPPVPVKLGFKRYNYNTMTVFWGDYSVNWSMDVFTNLWGYNLPFTGVSPLTNFIILEQYQPNAAPPGIIVKWLGFGYGSAMDDNDAGVYFEPEPINANYSIPENAAGTPLYTYNGNQVTGLNGASIALGGGITNNLRVDAMLEVNGTMQVDNKLTVNGTISGNGAGLTNVNEIYVSQSTNYTPATWAPVPGQVIFRASNNWMYAITVASSNAIFKINP
jgi:hypothetical protein